MARMRRSLGLDAYKRWFGLDTTMHTGWTNVTEDAGSGTPSNCPTITSGL